MAIKVEIPESNAGATRPNEQPQANPGVDFNIQSFGLTTRFTDYEGGGEEYEKLYELIKKELQTANENSKTEVYDVVKMTKTVNNLNYSSLIVTEKADNNVFAHILMIEATGRYPEKLTENIYGTRYEILRTPADALDSVYVNKARQVLSSFYNVNQDNVVIVDGTLVPSEFTPTEVNIRRLLGNAVYAVHSELSVAKKGYTGINVSRIVNDYRDGRFTISISFNGDGEDYFDQVNLPVRQDICISLSFKRGRTQNSRTINQDNESIEIVRTYGYIDFDFTGPTIFNGVPSTQKFIPNFVISHMESGPAPTPDIVMLGVISSLTIFEDLNWLQAFRPNPSKKGNIDFNDIGALNIEGNIENNNTGYGTKLNTKDKTFTLMDLGRFVNMVVRPTGIISIDVPKAGPDTWFTSIFSHLKYTNSQGAYARLMTHLKTLTNGLLAYEGPIFTEVTNKIHGGYWKDKNGVKDLRHLSSYLAVANFTAETNQRPDLITQYTNTLYSLSLPQEIRAAERKKYIDQMSNGSAVYKQFHDRLIFEGGFLTATVDALKRAGFAPISTNVGVSNEMFVRRTTMDITGATLPADIRVISPNTYYTNPIYSGWYNRNY